MKNKQDKTLLVSVVMPVYNAGGFLVEAVESIRHQTYKNWEFIIVDDCSTDKSLEMLKKYATREKRIRVYRNKKNLGIGKTMNLALKKTRGSFIARMDADDIAFPNRLETQIQFLTDHPDVGIVGSYMVEVDAKNRIQMSRNVPTTHESITRNMMISQTIQNPTLMINRKNIIQNELRYEGKYSPVDDLDFFFRNMPYTKFANIPQFLMAYRKHSDNSSLRNIKKTFALTWKVRMNALFKHSYKTDPQNILIHFIQGIIISLLPENILYGLFKLWKGKKARQSFLNFSTEKKAKKRLSLVVPMYKARSFAKENITHLADYLDKECIDYELIVVIDGDIDGTYSVLKGMEKSNRRIKIFAYPKNKGKGYAVRFGLKKAKKYLVGFVDAGFDIDTYSITTMMNEIQDHPDYDAYIADKQHPLSVCENIPFMRKIFSHGFNIYTNIFLASAFADTQVGLKIYRKPVLKKILAHLPLQINRFASDVEMLMELERKNYRVRSCPVIIRKDQSKSTVRLVDILEMAFVILKLSRIYTISKSYTLSEKQPLIQPLFRFAHSLGLI